jgi:hypothetical protein
MSPINSRPRYPGAQPFSDDDVWRKLFFGREQESVVLTNQILAHRLVVIFARSGLGKTSLLNAGVAERLRSEGFVPLSVRVNDVDKGPLDSIFEGIAAACRMQRIEYLRGNKLSLWHYFKTVEFWRDDILLKPIIILDQFEELFTLQSDEQRNLFINQLSSLVRGVRPAQPLTELAEPLDAVEYSPSALTDTPPVVKIVVSLREDFLAELEDLSDRIPGILDERFRLLPMTREAALLALQEPAKVEDANITSRPFQLEPLAVKEVLDFLERRTVPTARQSSSIIEPFQLQLVCQRLEDMAGDKEKLSDENRLTISLEDVGGERNLRDILRNFYRQEVSSLLWGQRGRVKKLCSEFLINPEGRRLRLEESEIKRLTGVRAQTLKILVDKRLLRANQTENGTYYELSHDSLVKPIIESNRWRLIRNIVIITPILAYFVLVMPMTTFFMEKERSYSTVFMSLTIALTTIGMLLLIGWLLHKVQESWSMIRRLRM